MTSRLESMKIFFNLFLFYFIKATVGRLLCHKVVAFKKAGVVIVQHESVRFFIQKNILAVAISSLVRRLLRQKNGVNVRQDAARRDRDAGEKLIQFFVVSHGELEMTRNDALFLVVARRVAGQFEDFGDEIFENGGHVDGRAGADAFGVVAASQETMNATDWELEAGARRPRLRLSTSFSTLSTSGHDCFGDRFRRSDAELKCFSICESFIYPGSSDRRVANQSRAFASREAA